MSDPAAPASDSFMLGVRLATLSQFTLSITPAELAQLRRDLIRWETLTPLLDPTTFQRDYRKMQHLHDLALAVEQFRNNLARIEGTPEEGGSSD